MTGSETFSSAMASATGYKRWLVDVFRSFFGRSILEVGLGDGGFSVFFPDHRSYIGLDIDGELLAAAREANPRGRFVRADIGDPAVVSLLADAEPDTIVCFNVLEHVSDDRAAIGNMARLLSPGGHLLLLVPAFDALFCDLDRLAGHLRRYNRNRLERLLPATLEVRKLGYINPLGGVGWWLNRFKRHRSLESEGVKRQVVFFDQVVLPLSRLLTPVTDSFFGQSVVCAARKR